MYPALGGVIMPGGELRTNGLLLLTGGTGCFGRVLLRHLLALAESSRPVLRLLVLYRGPAGFLRRCQIFASHPWLAFHAGDVQQPDSLLRGERFTHVLNAATYSTLRLPVPVIVLANDGHLSDRQTREIDDPVWHE